MIYLHIIAEGPTEKKFVEDLLCPHLGKFDICTDVCCVMTSSNNKTGKVNKGGIPNYQKAKNDILTRIKTDRRKESRFTTMFDLYALPNDFPGYAKSKKATTQYNKVVILEQALYDDIHDNRFVSYVQLHEFEALIFSNPEKLSEVYLDDLKGIKNLIKLSQKLNPEDINEGVETAPSKRILNEIAAYDKVFAGSEITKAIGLDTIRERCHHFNEWLTKLENLNS